MQRIVPTAQELPWPERAVLYSSLLRFGLVILSIWALSVRTEFPLARRCTGGAGTIESEIERVGR